MTWHLKLMFEWGGGCLWCDNAAARDVFGVGPVEERLGLSGALLSRLNNLSRKHDTALNWQSPIEPGPWTPEDHAAFEASVEPVLTRLEEELGPHFRVRYERL